jgi:hypothetical protein
MRLVRGYRFLRLSILLCSKVDLHRVSEMRSVAALIPRVKLTLSDGRSRVGASHLFTCELEQIHLLQRCL